MSKIKIIPIGYSQIWLLVYDIIINFVKMSNINKNVLCVELIKDNDKEINDEYNTI